MRNIHRSLVIFAIVLSFAAVQTFATAITPNTTLSAETGNNTSAADSFGSQSNGNSGASNVSKVDTRSLIYSAASMPIYAHFMAWFGGSNHMNVGYSSADSSQVARQVSDMMSRGISGAIIDWYGPNHGTENQTSVYMKQQAEAQNGNFVFAIMEDAGSLSGCGSTSNCTQNLINDLNYAYNTFETSSAYMRVNGQPVVFFFGVESLPITWSQVRNGISGNPIFIFENSNGFNLSQSNGAFSWVQINTSNANDWGQGYLDGFYSSALSHSGELGFAAGWKGFNDTLASWGSHRIVNQNCGQTWLSTLNELGRYYSSSQQARAIQLVTWNDYEEGTELESGIDNCVSLSGSASGSQLNWSISGNENTVDHYTVFVSLDGQNLMSLASVAAGTHALDLSKFGLNAATYTVYVKAVGRPSMTNKMSGPITATIGSGGGSPTPAPTPPPTTSGITVSSPLNGTTTTSPVLFVASNSSAVAMRIYVDNNAVYSVNASNLNTNVSMSTGSHYVVVQTWNAQGQVQKAAMNINVVAPSASGVTISSPANGYSGPSPLHVVASANAATRIVSTVIYVDNVNTWQTSSGSVDTYLSLGAGTHNVVVQAWDSNGTVYKKAVSVTMTAAAALNPTAVGVNVSTPSSGSKVSTSMHVVASASAGSTAIAAIRVYVDNAGVFTANASSIDTYVGVTSGAHYVVVQAWDTKGNVYKTPLNVTAN